MFPSERVSHTRKRDFSWRITIESTYGYKSKQQLVQQQGSINVFTFHTTDIKGNQYFQAKIKHQTPRPIPRYIFLVAFLVLYKHSYKVTMMLLLPSSGLLSSNSHTIQQLLVGDITCR